MFVLESYNSLGTSWDTILCDAIWSKAWSVEGKQGRRPKDALKWQYHALDWSDADVDAERAAQNRGRVRPMFQSFRYTFGIVLPSLDMPTAKHFLRRQYWQLLRLKGVISHFSSFEQRWFMPCVMQRRKKPCKTHRQWKKLKLNYIKTPFCQW